MSRRRTSFTLRRTVCWPVIASLPLLPLTVLAELPRGGKVSAGQAAISAPAPGSVRIDQSSRRAVIRWDNFNIGRQRSVVFAQPGAGAATLNIVTGNAGSAIAGDLRANGSVFLVNPHGIAITPTGKVDTAGGFIASTLAISESDFMGARLLFSGPGGAVRNEGTITTAAGGAVALLGSTVSNSGVIRAPLGQVALGSARKATLDLSGDGFLQVLVPAAAQGADGQPLVSNSGVIEADGGTVLLKAATLREAVREAVHMPGEVRARSVTGRDGAIVFDGGAGGAVSVSGKVDATAAAGASEGGRIDITGNSIALRGATVLATGPQEGGLVRIGGAYQGGHAPTAAKDAQDQRFTSHAAGPLANSATTSVDAASRIDVSATGAQGSGGTAIVWSEQATRMEGAVQATGAKAGGAVEISSRSTVQKLALDRVRIGQGGTLLLDPKDIVIGSGSGPDSDSSYVATSDVTGQLEAGTSLVFKASNDIEWFNGFVFITPPGSGRAGNLTLRAGRSVTLDGSFNTGLGDWTIIANDTAANGVDPALRGPGGASIHMASADFINSNGKLRLTLADGAGNGNGAADGSKGTIDRISVGRFSGDALTVEVAPTAVPEYSPAPIQLFGSVDAANAVTLTGNIFVGAQDLRLAGRTVTWTNEKTGGTMRGEGTIRFVENGATTRLGKTGGADATRLELGSAATVTRVYGDADPDQAGLGNAVLHVASHSPRATAPDALGEVFAAGSLTVTGPGVTANAGARALGVQGASGAAFKPVEYDVDGYTVGGASGSYFVDMTPGAVNMTVTRRALTAGVLAPSYTYGSPAAAATLTGVVNGDAIRPRATVAGSTVTMTPNGAGFGFAANLDAGTQAFTLTGITGTGASNYTVSLPGNPASSVSIARKPITYTGTTASQVYGTAALPSPELNGLLTGDTVTGGTQSISVVSSGQAGGSGARPVGSYDVGLASLAGADSGNYVLAGSGNTPHRVTITAKPITWQVAANASTTYGTTPTGLSATLGGVLTGDAIGAVLAADGAAIGPRIDAGNHALTVNGLTGTGAGNYQLAGSGNQSRTLSVARKPLTFGGIDVSQVYGQADAAAPVLQGVESGDTVTPVVTLRSGSANANTGESGALPVGEYTTQVASLTGASAGNYLVASTGNTFRRTVVTPKSVTFQLAGGSSNTVYGTAATLPTLTLSGIVTGDVIGGQLAALDGSEVYSINARTPAGTYQWGLSGFTGAAAGNYRVASSGNTVASLSIARKPITWQVAAGTAVYGDALSNTTQLNGVLGGDTVLPVLSARDSGGNVDARPDAGGNYTAAVTGLDGAAGGNYALQATGSSAGNLTVTQRPLTYVTANSNSVYGTLATPGAVTLQNVVSGETVGTTLAFARNGADVALTARTDAGTYRQRVAGVTDPNYYVQANGNVDANLVIAPRLVSLDTPDSTMVYGNTAPLRASTLRNVLAGDDVAASPTRYQYAWIPASTLDVGTYADMLTASSLLGADARNYEINQAASTNGTLQVTRRPITYSLALVYNGAQLGDKVTFGALRPNGNFERGAGDGARATLAGVLQRDQSQVQMGSDTMGMPTLGQSSGGYYTVGSYTWTGGTLSGLKAGNYVLADTGNTDVTLRIEPRPLQVYTLAQGPSIPARAVYGASDQFAPATIFTPLHGDQVGASAVIVTPQGRFSQIPARLDVGSYPLDLAGPLQGADAANYAPRVVQTTLQVTPRPLHYSVADTRSTYGQQAVVGAATLFDVLAGDTVAVAALDVTRGGAGVTLEPRSRAGDYRVSANGLAGSSAGNYMLAGDHRDRPGTHTIQTAPVTLAYDPAQLAFTFGTPFVLPSLQGTLFNDDLSYSATAAPVRKLPQVPGGTRVLANGVLLDAQDYALNASLAGSRAGNYHLVNPWAPISVARKAVTTDLRDRTAVYGSYIGEQRPAVSGLVPGHAATASVVSAYQERSGVGKHAEEAFLTGGEHYNYELPRRTVDVTVTPRALTFTGAAPASATYGDAVRVGTLSGVLFDDDVRLAGTVSVAGVPNHALRPAASGNGGYFYDGRPSVGPHDFTAQPTSLAGSASGNYQLPAAVNGRYTVTPRTLTWSVADASFMYGGFKSCESGQHCYAWERLGTNLDTGDRTTEPPQYGAVRFDNLVAGDDVRGKQALIDQRGRTGAISADLPAGPYYQVVTGIEGAAIGNYVVAGAGNKPGVLTVKPQWVAYDVASGVFMPGLGMVGTPGKVNSLTTGTTQPGVGNPLRADVTPVVVARGEDGKVLADLSAMQPGRYILRVEGFTGPDAANYRVISDTTYFRPYPNAATPFWVSRVGFLDTFADATLGLGLSKLEPVPKPPPITPVVEAPEGFFKVSSGLGPEFGRYDNVTGAAGNVEIGVTGGQAAGRVQAVAESSVNLGNAQLSAQAGSAAEALIKFGVTGVKARAEAGVHADGRIDSGAGFVMAGVQAGVEVEMEAGREGAKLNAEAIAGANTKGGAAGNIGIGDGKADGTVSVFAYARSDNEWTFKDGKLVTKFDDSIGVGASAATSIGFATGPASVDAGVIVYSPGSLGGTFDFSGGFSDGVISLGIDLGAQIGIFGGGFSLNVSFDVTGFTQSLGDNSTVQAIANFFGFSIPGTPKPDPADVAGPRAASKAGNPQDRYSYMMQNPEWKKAGHGYTSNMAFMSSYEVMQSRAQALLEREVKYQQTFLELMKTDSQKAIEFLRTDSPAAMKADEIALSRSLADMGLKMAMKDGKLVFINK